MTAPAASLSVAQRPVLTVGEVADLLGTTRTTVEKMIHEGLIPSIRLGSQGKKSPIRIPRKAFDAWLEGES